MALPNFTQLMESKLFVAALSALVGGFLGNLIAVLRGRIKTLEYSVNHDRVALSGRAIIFL